MDTRFDYHPGRCLPPEDAEFAEKEGDESGTQENRKRRGDGARGRLG
jgi:hypothetical protein